MKFKIDMMQVWDMIHTLEGQNDEKSTAMLSSLKEMFEPLLKESAQFNCPPTYDVEADSLSEEKEENDSAIDWEQRRYEIAKDCVAAEINAIMSNPRLGSVSQMEIARKSVGMADALIKELKGELC